jgi:hypothetical protein
LASAIKRSYLAWVWVGAAAAEIGIGRTPVENALASGMRPVHQGTTLTGFQSQTMTRL